ncbi:MAG: type II secretion system F family protein, partial [Phycisphaerae bacterium]|nr:type II secretion system F family protein [Phycisphaerae bacterium]
VFVLPRFEKIYAGKGAALPLPTRILLGLSAGILSYWPFILGGLTALCVGGYLYLRTPGGKKFLDWVRINMPIIGSMYRKACLARSLRTMATMISTGVSILEGLAITAQVAGNYFYSNIWLGLSQRVQEGSTLSEQLFQCPLVPRSLSQMIAAGERTGRLATVMERVAGFCEDDLKVAVKTVTQMIEPVMIIMMGLIIGGIAMALLLPVFSVSKMMAK